MSAAKNVGDNASDNASIGIHFLSVLAISLVRVRRNGTSELLVNNMTPPSAPATSISCETDVVRLPDDVFGIFYIFLRYMHVA